MAARERVSQAGRKPALFAAQSGKRAVRQDSRAPVVQVAQVHRVVLSAEPATILTDRALTGLRSDQGRLSARLRHAFARSHEDVAADVVITDLGTESLDELFHELVADAFNLGEYDHEALVALQPQPRDANPDGRFQLFRIGDALSARDIHAAILDANRLCRVI